MGGRRRSLYCGDGIHSISHDLFSNKSALQIPSFPVRRVLRLWLRFTQRRPKTKTRVVKESLAR